MKEGSRLEVKSNNGKLFCENHLVSISDNYIKPAAYHDTMFAALQRLERN
jgi:hypothetical protein